MEDLKSVSSAAEHTKPAATGPGVGWRDLRDWLALADRIGSLHHITSIVDPDLELATITYLAAQREDSPALLFERLKGDATGARVLTNMLGASRERYALAVGIDPTLSTRDMILETRKIMKRRVAPTLIAEDAAPVNEIVVTGGDVDLTKFPAPRFWPGDGGAYVGTGNITLTRDPATDRINVGVYRQMLHGPREVGLYCSPGKHGLLDRLAWWAKGEPCPVVAAYGIDPVLFMVGAQSFSAQQSELDVRAECLAGRWN